MGSSARSRASEHSLSREGSRQSLASDKASATNTGSPRASQARGESRTASNGRHVRSNSMASLRSPTAGPRSTLKRDSKSDEKGLSFFKAALRQKETRRSADLGRTSLLSRKAAGSSAKAEERPDKGGPKATPQPPQRSHPGANPPTKEASPAKRTLTLPGRKAKPSPLEVPPPSPGSSKRAPEKASRKPSTSMYSPTRPPSKSQ